jgi:hypothetical protein
VLARINGHSIPQRQRTYVLALEEAACQLRSVSKIELELRYRPDDEWHGQLDAIVTSGEFSGKGSAWFGGELAQLTSNRFWTASASRPFSQARRSSSKPRKPRLNSSNAKAQSREIGLFVFG